jgi:hydroxyethylthiazole kinase-like uncharacterized protein yjeF
MCPLHLDELVVDVDVLRSFPLRRVDGDATKQQRGTAVVVGGSAETPGGALLAATAALRMGAGKVHVATVASVAPALGVALPEARVIAMRETATGAIDPTDVERASASLARADAVLVGTSALDPDATGELLAAVVPIVSPHAALVVDAVAIPCLLERPELLCKVADRTSVIPNPSEMAALLGEPVERIAAEPHAALDEAVRRLGSVVSLRDTTTWTSAPGRPCYLDDAGHHALGSSGSGDVLAGALAGLCARGANPLSATLWSAHLHGLAGERLGRFGVGIGTLARELLDELPRVMRILCPEAC